MPQAIQVTEKNLADILVFADGVGFDLSYLHDHFDFMAGIPSMSQDLYLITDGSSKTNNITFTEMYGEDFRNLWKFAEPQDPNEFVRIERV